MRPGLARPLGTTPGGNGLVSAATLSRETPGHPAIHAERGVTPRPASNHTVDNVPHRPSLEPDCTASLVLQLKAAAPSLSPRDSS